MAEDEFGEGLETPVYDDDAFMSRFREMMEVPDDANVGDLADYLEKIQAQADRTADLERAVQEREATIAGLALSKTPEHPQAPREVAAQKRFNVSQVSEELKPYIKNDYVKISETGLYEPNELVKGHPQVIRACDAINTQLRQQQMVLESFSTDPYSAVNECLTYTPAYASLLKEFQDFKKTAEERFGQFSELSEKQKRDQFNMQHFDVLTKSDPSNPNSVDWSKAGQYYNKMIQKGMKPEDAIELAREYANELQTQEAPAPSKPKPKVMDRIQKRTAAEGRLLVERGPKSPLEVPHGKWRQEMRDVRKRVHQEMDN